MIAYLINKKMLHWGPGDEGKYWGGRGGWGEVSGGKKERYVLLFVIPKTIKFKKMLPFG